MHTSTIESAIAAVNKEAIILHREQYSIIRAENFDDALWLIREITNRVGLENCVERNLKVIWEVGEEDVYIQWHYDKAAFDEYLDYQESNFQQLHGESFEEEWEEFDDFADEILY